MAELLAWHFLPDNGRFQHRHGRGRPKVEVGKAYTVEPPIILCERGLHASERAIDALSYAPGSLVCRVRVSGEIVRDKDKLVASERTVLWMADATAVLHEFSAWVAEQALDLVEERTGQPADPRSRAAIDAKRRWLRKEITDAELDAAWDAACAAARAAAWDAACAAAWDAAWAATRDAAWDAACAAARAAARDAAWDAARDRWNDKLTEMLLALGPL